MCLHLFCVSFLSFIGSLVSLEIPSQLHYTKILSEDKNLKKGESSKQCFFVYGSDSKFFPSTGENLYRDLTFYSAGASNGQTQSLVSGKSLCDFFLQTQNRLKVIPTGIFLSKSKSPIPNYYKDFLAQTQSLHPPIGIFLHKHKVSSTGRKSV